MMIILRKDRKAKENIRIDVREEKKGREKENLKKYK